MVDKTRHIAARLLLSSAWLSMLVCLAASTAYATPVSDSTPSPDDADDRFIESVTLHRDPLAISIHLTDDGIELAGTCDGAAILAADVVNRYRDLPEATGTIDWAEDRMTQEIYGHGRAAAGDIPLPDAVERANPVTIVFTDYTDPLLALSDVDAWALQRGYSALYRANCQS